MDIVEVARVTGVPASAMRHYEAKGLIRSVGRRGLRRVFAPDVVERLALISLGSAAGLTLDEMASMFPAGARPRVNRALLARKADELDAAIVNLARVRDGLRHAAACPAADQLECPRFLRLVGIAAARRKRPAAPSRKAPQQRR